MKTIGTALATIYIVEVFTARRVITRPRAQVRTPGMLFKITNKPSVAGAFRDHCVELPHQNEQRHSVEESPHTGREDGIPIIITRERPKMNNNDALKILGLKADASQEEIKNAYRHACLKYHPDRNPAGLEVMKLVNVAYETLATQGYDGKGTETTTETNPSDDYGEVLNTAINAVLFLDGIIIEICGLWIWLSGNTYPHREVLKQAGYRWSRPKTAWYFRPEEARGRNHGKPWEFDKIKEVYGSQTPTKQKHQSLA